MAEKENVNVAEAGAQATAKKKRRGISNETRGTSQLRFHEKDVAKNGLFIGHLEDVEVKWSVNADGKKFTGLNAPRLVFHFASNHAKKEEQRHYYHSLFPVESNVNTIPNGADEWQVTSLFDWIKHMLDTFYLRGRQMTEAEEDALTLDFEDFDEQGEYIPVEPEDVLKAYGILFENVVAMLNGTFNLKDGETPKACYKDANGKPLQIWMKLLRHRKRKNEWINVGNNGELGMDNFVGAGVIELYDPKTQVPARLRIDLSRESIIPQEVKKAPSIGTPGMGGLAVPGVAPEMPMDMGGAFSAAGEEMPF